MASPPAPFTWLANICVFCLRLRSICWSRESFQAWSIEKSKVSVAAAITRTKAANNLKNIRFLTSYSSLRGLEAVARAPHRLEKATGFGIGFDLLANAAAE